MHLAITGTGTDIGKTYVAALLLKMWQSLGHRVAYYKPVASGCYRHKQGHLWSSDADTVQSVADVPAYISYALEEPLAPYAAGFFERFDFCMDVVLQQYGALQKQYTATLVEGVGGAAVPLTRHTMASDMLARLEIPVLIVTANRLGMLNHTLLTIEHLRRRSIPLWGIIVNDVCPAKGDVSVHSNEKVLADITDVPVLVRVAYGQKQFSYEQQEILLNHFQKKKERA